MTKPSMATRPRRVLGYARVSSEEQARGSSLQDQQNAIRAYAKSQGHEVAKVYVEAESAVHEKIERREQIQALLVEARDGDLVICDKLDRWSRDTEFTLRSVRELREKGVAFYSVADQCDPATRDGDMMLTMRAMFAKEEHRRIKERMVGTRRILRDQGYYVEGLPPFGYRRAHPKGYKGAEKNVLVIEPSEAKTVRTIFKAAISGKPISAIADALGINRDLVADTLHRRIFIGEIDNSQGEWIKGKHPPIIDADTFTRAALALASRRLGQARGAPSETTDWVLRDVAKCALCNGRMSSAYAGPHEARRYYFRCFKKCTSRFVPVRLAENAIGPLVVGRLAELRESLGADDVAPAAPASVDFSILKSKLAKKRDRLIEMHADGITSRAELVAGIAKVDAERLKLDGREGAANAPPRLADARVRRATLASVSTLARAWKSATGAERRRIVNLLASAVLLEAGKDPRPTWLSREDLARAYA